MRLGIVIILLMTATGVFANINMVENPGFELIQKHLPINWSPARGWKGKSKYSTSSDSPYKGARCTVITRPINDGGTGAFLSSFIPVEPNQKYIVSGWLKSFGDARVDLALRFFDTKNKPIKYQRLKTVRGNSNWVQGKTEVTAPLQASKVRILLVVSGAGAGSFDELYLSLKGSSANSKPQAKSTSALEMPAEKIRMVGNLVKNGDFAKLNNCKQPVNWHSAKGWKGKTFYSASTGSISMQRSDKAGSGAWISNKIPVKGGQLYYFSGSMKTDKVSNRADLAAYFFDVGGKRINYQLLAKCSGSNKWKSYSKIFVVPVQAVSVQLLLVQSGTGQSWFRDIFLGTDMPDSKRKTEAGNFILNSSFEENDFNPDFIDCFSVNSGKATRQKTASHGFHALRLGPDTRLVYGRLDVPSIALPKKRKLYYSLDLHGTGKLALEILYFDVRGLKLQNQSIPLAGQNPDRFIRRSGTITPPSAAQYAALSLYNPSKNSAIIVDALYLGEKKFSEKFLPSPIPVITFEHNSTPAIPPSKVKLYQGVPTWFLEDKPIVNSIFTMGARYFRSPSNADYAKRVLQAANFPLIMIVAEITPQHSGEKYTLLGALEKIDKQVRQSLAVTPDAKFILWIFQEPSYHFSRNYPDNILEVENKHLPWKYHVPPYSYGSEIWGKLCARSIAELLQELNKRPYGNRIVAIMPGMGKYGENNFGHAHLHGGYSAHDFSPAMHNFFRKWLFKDYQQNVRSFGKAWQRQHFNFSSAAVPSSLKRLAKPIGIFYDPKTQRDVIDYTRCDSAVIVHRVLEQVRAAKEVTGGKIFTLSQFAYFSSAFTHREFAAILKAPYLDALAPAAPYMNRGAGDDIIEHGPVASVYQAGKVWFFQADVRTHLADDGHRRFGRTSNASESVAVLVRDLGHCMVRGIIPYFMTFGQWYANPEIMQLVAKFDNFMELSGYFPRKSQAEIAIVMDPLSLSIAKEVSYTRRTMSPSQSFVYNRQTEWHHLGTPYDYYLIDELLASDKLDQYKLVIMAHTLVLTPEQRKLIKYRLHKNNRTIVYIYAPGIINYKDSKLDYNSKYTSISGFKLKMDDALHDLRIKTNGRIMGKFYRDIYGGFVATPDKPIKIRPETFRPRLSVIPGKGIKVLGRYASDNAVGFASRKFPTHKAVFWGSTALNKEVLRKLARNAGVHLYIEGNAVIYASANFAVFHVPEAGKHRIKLARKAEIIVNMISGETLGRNTSAINHEFAKNDSLLIYFGKASELDNAREDLRQRAKKRSAIAAQMPKYSFELTSPKTLARAASILKTYATDDGGFIKHWLILGPFPNYDKNPAFDVDYLKTTGGETGTRPASQQEYKIVFDARGNNREAERTLWFNGKSIKKELRISWCPTAFSKGIITPLYRQIDSFMTFNKICYYAACYINVEKDAQAVLCIGSDDGNKVYVNGKLVTKINVPQGRGLRPDSERALVKLHKGSNLILVKILQGGGGLGHAVRFKHPDSGKVFKDFIIKLKK